MKKPLEKKWAICPKIPNEINSELSEFPPIFRQVLFNRGITSQQDAHYFLNAEGEIFDPYLLKDMNTAVEKIHNAMKNQKKIMVFGDYDADGVTATALLVQALKELDADVEAYIPNRFEEGYGFSMVALQEVLALKPNLLITVDCGVRSIEEVNQARLCGMEVIITDHHQPKDDYIPAAAAVICPKQRGDTYPFQFLAGVGIAYKLAQALLIGFSKSMSNADKFLDLVAIGTVADLAPLAGENRALVKKGLNQIKKGERIGISALASVSGIRNPQSINTNQIGFMIGPRLNAAGRLNTAETAFRLLMAEEQKAADDLAGMLERDNQERRLQTKRIYQLVDEYFSKQEDRWLLYYSDEKFNEGVVGLAAARLVESFYRPAIVGSINGEFIRASCRSISEVNITRALDECAHLLVRHGGHAMAAGFTMKKENEDQFFQEFNSILESQLAGKDLIPAEKADLEVSLSELNPAIIPWLNTLEPCGEANPVPLFISRNVEVVRISTMGKDGEHIRMDVRSRIDQHNRSRITYSAVGFFMGSRADMLEKGAVIDILYSFDNNEFNGRVTPQLTIRDLKPAV